MWPRPPPEAGWQSQSSRNPARGNGGERHPAGARGDQRSRRVGPMMRETRHPILTWQQEVLYMYNVCYMYS